MVAVGDGMAADDTPTRELERKAARLERAEERLVPTVEQVEAGQLVIRRRTTTEPETVDVSLSHDELDVERINVERPLGDGELPVREVGDETVVLVVEERLEVRKVPWVVEEIHIRRRLVTETQAISDEVRKERVDIETTGDVVLDERKGG